MTHTCDTLVINAGCTLVVAAGDVLAVNTALMINGSMPAGTRSPATLECVDTFTLSYYGTVANQNISNAVFTNVSANVPIYSYNGGAITNCVNVIAVTPNDFGGWLAISTH